MEDQENADSVEELDELENNEELDGEGNEEGEEGDGEDLSWADEGDEPDPSNSIPIPPGAMKKKRHQLRAEKLAKKDLAEELDRVKAQLAEIQSSKSASEPPKRPLRSECDDDDEYDEKYDAYRDDKDAFDRSTTAQSNGKKEAQQKQQQAISEEVGEHYTRADKFVKANANITPEIYKAADAKVREIAENVHGAAGDSVIDMLISALGDGSEKVMLHVGRNKASMARFAALMASDGSGLKVVSFLTDKKNEINGSKTKTSQAPKPAATASGNANAVPANERAWRKKYDKASEGQARFDIKMQAKAAGVKL